MHARVPAQAATLAQPLWLHQGCVDRPAPGLGYHSHVERGGQVSLYESGTRPVRLAGLQECRRFSPTVSFLQGWDEAFLRRLCPRALARRRVMLRSPSIRFRPGNRWTCSRSHDHAQLQATRHPGARWLRGTHELTGLSALLGGTHGGSGRGCEAARAHRRKAFVNLPYRRGAHVTPERAGSTRRQPPRNLTSR
jgi:hypothetical protein